MIVKISIQAAGYAYSGAVNISSLGYNKLIITEKDMSYSITTYFIDGTSKILSERGVKITTEAEFDIINSTKFTFLVFVNTRTSNYVYTDYKLVP